MLLEHFSGNFKFMKRLTPHFSMFSLVAALAGLGACSSTPKPPVYSGDAYNPKKAEAFTLNFFLSITRADSKGKDFDVEVFDRATGKEIDIREREIKVFWKNEDHPQKVEKTGKNDFSFSMEKQKYCWDGVFGFIVEDPRTAVQKTTISLIPLCEAGL